MKVSYIKNKNKNVQIQQIFIRTNYSDIKWSVVNITRIILNIKKCTIQFIQNVHSFIHNE